MNKGDQNKANFLKIPRFYIGCPFESLYLERNAHYPRAIMVNKCFYIFSKRKRYVRKTV